MHRVIIRGTVQSQKLPFVHAFVFPGLFGKYAALGESNIVSAHPRLRLHFPVGKPAPQTETERYTSDEVACIHEVLKLFRDSRIPENEVMLNCYRHVILASSARWLNFGDVDLAYYPESYAVVPVDSSNSVDQEVSALTGLPVEYTRKIVEYLK